MINESAAHL